MRHTSKEWYQYELLQDFRGRNYEVGMSIVKNKMRGRFQSQKLTEYFYFDYQLLIHVLFLETSQSYEWEEWPTSQYKHGKCQILDFPAGPAAKRWTNDLSSTSQVHPSQSLNVNRCITIVVLSLCFAGEQRLKQHSSAGPMAS